MHKILLTGKNGQLGFELQRTLPLLGEVIAVGRDKANFADPLALRTMVREVHPDIIVNAAAYTAVDKAEEDRELAYAVNATAAKLLAEEASHLGIPLVHYSTNYVFDGLQEVPYSETDPPHPISVYGQSKWLGEEAIRTYHPSHIILRTSWVFGLHGNNFLKKMLQLAKTSAELPIVADQWGTPTSASLIAQVTTHLVAQYMHRQDQSFPFGTYHLTASGATSWYEYALTFLRAAEALGVVFARQPLSLRPTAAQEYLLHARRPINGRLETDKLQQTFALHLPPWQQEVQAVLQLLLEKPL